MIALVVGLAATAHADPRTDAEAALRAHLASFATDPLTPAMAASNKAYVDSTASDGEDVRNWGTYLVGNYVGDPAFKLAAPTLVVDPSGHAAWFYLRATFKYREVVGEGITAWAKPVEVRLTGVLVDDGGWKVARIAYATAMPDKDMIAHAGYQDPPLAPASGSPRHTGDAAIAQVVDGWFKGRGGAGFVAGAGTGDLAANGTAPAELAANRAAALKLAKAWDRLKLAPTEVDATAFGGLGFVRVTVRLPVKPTRPAAKGPHAAELTLFAVVVDEGGTWKWRALDWTAR